MPNIQNQKNEINNDKRRINFLGSITSFIALISLKRIKREVMHITEAIDSNAGTMLLVSSCNDLSDQVTRDTYVEVWLDIIENKCASLLSLDEKTKIIERKKAFSTHLIKKVFELRENLTNAVKNKNRVLILIEAIRTQNLPAIGEFKKGYIYREEFEIILKRHKDLI